MWEVHRSHHKFYNPSPFAVIADEWMDQLVRAAPLLVLPTVMPMNLDLLFFTYVILFYGYGTSVASPRARRARGRVRHSAARGTRCRRSPTAPRRRIGGVPWHWGRQRCTMTPPPLTVAPAAAPAPRYLHWGHELVAGSQCRCCPGFN